MTEVPGAAVFEFDTLELTALLLLYESLKYDGLIFAIENENGSWSEMLTTLKKLEAFGLSQLVSTGDVELKSIDDDEVRKVKAHKFKLTEDMGFVLMNSIAGSGIQAGEVLLKNSLTGQLLLFKFDFKEIDSSGDLNDVEI